MGWEVEGGEGSSRLSSSLLRLRLSRLKVSSTVTRSINTVNNYSLRARLIVVRGRLNNSSST